MYSLIIKSSDIISKLHTKDDEKESLKAMTQLIDKAVKKEDKLSETLDLSKITDWPMHLDANNITVNGRPSILLKQSIDDDIVSILKNSESRTWDALDTITNKLNNQTEQLDSLNHRLTFDCTPTVDNHTVHSSKCNCRSLDSPLIDTIKLDIIQEIHDKVDSIDSKVSMLSDNITQKNASPATFSSQKSNGQVTHHLITANVPAPSLESCFSQSTGNPDVTDKRKEAMTQLNQNKNIIVPEIRQTSGLELDLVKPPLQIQLATMPLN